MVNLSSEAGHCLTMRSYCFNWAAGTWETGVGTLIPHAGKEEVEEGLWRCLRVRCIGGICSKSVLKSWMFAMTSCMYA